jgi:hypothetical protein
MSTAPQAAHNKLTLCGVPYLVALGTRFTLKKIKKQKKKRHLKKLPSAPSAAHGKLDTLSCAGHMAKCEIPH